jgi:hypothetical protein
MGGWGGYPTSPFKIGVGPLFPPDTVKLLATRLKTQIGTQGCYFPCIVAGEPALSQVKMRRRVPIRSMRLII